ncbi:helix-turn-helix domain-containing protein [Patulibacter defluvii]|uniref:helix-turn-helix domain-containing protein n=1 Tax=Patulibacter defluvii TaxID=3095358 RepID=UPI002A755682|nr:helix-turn-helix domain-containing protein [Patulibacter sp. DM4]
MSRVRTRPTREETVARLLDAAVEVFAERGIAAATVSQIAAAAGLTKGAVYSNFAGKDDLILAIMDRQAAGRLAQALAAVDAAADLPSALRDAGVVLVRELRVDAVWHRLLAEYFALSSHDEQLRARLREHRREAKEAVAAALTQLAERLAIALPMPAEDLSVTIFGLSNGLGIESGIDPDGVPDDLLARVLALIFADALAG